MEFVEGHERLTSVFGRWPSFHDAEILALGYESVREGVSLLFVAHLWESTSEVDERGYFRLVKHTRATLRFHDCDEIAIDVNGFHRQNVIGGLWITFAADSLPDRPVRVEFSPLSGVGGSLSCRRAELVESEPYECGAEAGRLRYEAATT